MEKEKESREKKKLIPEIMILPLFVTLALNGAVYYGSRFVNSGRVHYNMTSKLDEQIPFVPWTAAIYLGCYVFWAVNYMIGCREEKEDAFRFISADFAAKLVCLVCFLVFPTTNIRPAVPGHSLWEEVIKLIYRLDEADNLFPSIHCLTSWFCFIAVRRNEKIPGWYRAASFLIAAGVCISTLTTRQHVLADVAGGILLAEGSYLFVKRSGFSVWYGRVMEKIHDLCAGKRSAAGNEGGDAVWRKN